MSKSIQIREAEKIEITTLQDNYIDLTASDNNDVITRALPLNNGEVSKSILAEHGFSALVKTSVDGRERSLLFDFGFSSEGTAYNAKALGIQMETIEMAALSHGHSDHTGGLECLIQMIGKANIEFIAHPSVFKENRYLRINESIKIFFPKLTKERIEAAGCKLIESRNPRLILSDTVLFLGEIPRTNEIEKGIPNAFFGVEGEERKDAIEDDTSLVMNLKGKGLVILSGCAHSGIINTVSYARHVTGIERVHVVMGGLHLGGPIFDPIITPTTEMMKRFNPSYIVPTHCTGRSAVMQMEREMPDKFILNMSGTTLKFT
jgi:7,8-dihydropterin-6-yl-methyl-4-(beta-D-ribofuranosyl)aminobenzene 5'-phosphate synthase